MYILMAYYCTRNQYGLCEARSMQRRSVYTTPKTRSVTSFSFISSPISLKCEWIFLCTETVSYFFLSFLWNTDRFFLCEPETVTYFYFFSYFFFKTDKFFRVQRPPVSSFFSIFSLLYEIQINFLCIQRPSMHSFSYFFFHVFEVEIILFCRQRLSVSSFSSILLVFLFVAPNKHQYQGQETCYIQHIYFLYLLHLCLC